MSTSYATIRQWVLDAKAAGADFLIVKCDEWDHSDYPVSSSRAEFDRLVKGDRVMEVYDLSMDLEAQLAEHRAYHPPQPEKKIVIENAAVMTGNPASGIVGEVPGVMVTTLTMGESPSTKFISREDVIRFAVVHAKTCSLCAYGARTDGVSFGVHEIFTHPDCKAGKTHEKRLKLLGV